VEPNIDQAGPYDLNSNFRQRPQVIDDVPTVIYADSIGRYFKHSIPTGYQLPMQSPVGL
jgi:hypothetical protein